MGAVGLEPSLLEHLGEQAEGIEVVVDDQDPLGPQRALTLERRAARVPRALGRRQGGEPHHELAPLAHAIARGPDLAAVGLDQAADDREPEPEPALRAIERLPALVEGLEHVGQHLGRDPDPRVAHPERDALALEPRRDPDRASPLGVLRRVGHEVGDHLGEADRVAVDEQAPERDVRHQLVAALLEQRARDLDRLGDHVREVEVLAVELDPAAGDPRDIEQVVDEPDDVTDLARDHRALALERLGIAQLHQLEGGQDRGERVAELVAEHREELVLRAIGDLGLGAGLLDPLACADLLAHVERERHHPVDHPAGIAERADRDVEVARRRVPIVVPVVGDLPLAALQPLAGRHHLADQAGVVAVGIDRRLRPAAQRAPAEGGLKRLVDDLEDQLGAAHQRDRDRRRLDELDQPVALGRGVRVRARELAEQVGTLDRHGGPVRERQRERQVILVVAPVRLAHDQRDRADRGVAATERDPDVRAQAELLDHRDIGRRPRARREHLGGDPRDQLGLAGPDDLPDPTGRREVLRKPPLDLRRELEPGGVDVRDGEPLELAILEHVDRAPVGDRRDRDPGERCERGVVVERPVQHLDRIRDEGASALRADLGSAHSLRPTTGTGPPTNPPATAP